MNHQRLLKQLDFLLEVDKVKNIFRNNYLADGSRKENDAEHSWHLSLMVLILAEHFKGIDILKTAKMVIIHDLVEIFAGDAYCYDLQAQDGKFEREKAAAEKLYSLLPTDQKQEYFDLWMEFEEGKSKEAICAAIADRIQPLLLNYHSQGKSWMEHDITGEMVKNRNKIVFEKGSSEIAEFVKSTIEDAVCKGYLK